MSPVKRPEGEKHSSTDNCEGIANNCNELKTTQLLKDEDANLPHSSIIKETKISPLQISPNSTFTSSGKDKIFFSLYELDSIEKSEKGDTETAGSLIQIHPSSEIKREETKACELNESLNNDENQLTSGVFQTSKTSEIQKAPCSPVLHLSFSSVQIHSYAAIKEEETSVSPSNNYKIFSPDHEIYSIEKAEGIGMETADSSVRKLLSPVIKRVETSVAESCTSLNYVGNELHYLEFQTSKTSPTTSSPIVMAFKEDKIFSSDLVIDFIEKPEKDATETAGSSIQIHLSPEIKREETNAGELHGSLNDDENQLTSGVSQTSKTSEIQETPWDPVTSFSSVQIHPSAAVKEEETSVSPSNNYKIFSPGHEIYSIEKAEGIGMETADSSVRKLLSPVIKRDETSVAEPCTSLNYVGNELNYLKFQTSKTSPTTSSPIVMPFKEDKIFSSDLVIDLIEKPEKDTAETAGSSIQIHLSSEIKREETNAGELHGSLNDDENQLTSGVFQTSKTSEIQETPWAPVTSFSSVQIHPSAAVKEEETSVSPSYNYKIFSPHHGIYSIEKAEEIGSETADSSVRKLLSSIIKRVETSVAEPCTSLNYVGNQLHNLEFQISKTSPTTSSSIVMPINEDKILSPRLVIDFIEDSEKNDSENTVSSAQKRLNSTIKKRKKRLGKSRRNLNNVENQPPSIVFQLSEISPMQTTSSSTVTITNEEKKISFQCKTRSTENLEKNDTESVSSSVQVPLRSRIKSVKTTVGDLRKSLRLLELKNESNSSEGDKLNIHKQEDLYDLPVKTGRKAKKRATKRKFPVNSASPSPTEAHRKKIAPSITQNPSTLHPSKMDLKSIILIPAPRKPDTPSTIVVDFGIYPRFANVDPSKVLSSLNRQVNIIKGLACGKAISLFFPRGFTSQEVTSEQYSLTSNQKPMLQYKFKEANFGPMHLSKKYPVLDSFTMDKCYGKLFSFPKLLK